MTQISIIQKVINSVLKAFGESKAHLDNKVKRTMDKGMDFVDDGDVSYYSAIKRRQVDNVKKLIHNFPEGLREKDKRDLLPIHLACMANRYSAERFKACYFNGYCAMSLEECRAIDSARNVEIIRLLVEADPTTLREHSASGHLPLHCAVEDKAPVDAIRLLIETFPESLRVGIQKTFLGIPCQFLPIHLSLELPSCYNGGPNNSREVVKALMRADPEALKVFHNIRGEYVTSLYRTFKEFHSTNLDGYRIILALEEYVNAKANNNLEERRSTEPKIAYSLHTLLTFQFFRHQNEKDAPINDVPSYKHYQQEFVLVLQKLLHRVEGLYCNHRNHYYKNGNNISPYSILVQPDEKGDLPLHIAVASGHRIEVLEFLTQMHPEAVCQPNGKGDLPWKVALATNAHTSVTEFLLKAYLEACLPRGGGGDYPTMIASASLAAASSLDGLSLLYHFLLTHPALLKYHCSSSSSYGATKDVEIEPQKL